MAWRLNAVLASLYPAAIPASFRMKPKAKSKQHKVFGRSLPCAVITMLSKMRSEPSRSVRYDRLEELRPPLTANPHALQFDYGDRSEAVHSEAEKILAMIGGVRHNKNAHVWFEFEFSPREALDEIIIRGCVPDQRAHQFYPTPDELAVQVVELANIGDEHTCFEPSAGIGGIADHMPQGTRRDQRPALQRA